MFKLQYTSMEMDNRQLMLIQGPLGKQTSRYCHMDAIWLLVFKKSHLKNDAREKFADLLIKSKDFSDKLD